jgi:hypothetical protein
VIGLVTDADDLTVTVVGVAVVQARVLAHAAGAWALVDANNIPPGDRRAAEVDLAETLNQYLLALRNVHMLLGQAQVARPTLDDYAQRYNAALRRFLRAREAHDGSLSRHWPPDVLSNWRTLREAVWSAHQNFWRINPQMAEIYTRQRSNEAVRGQMAAMEPHLLRLETEIAQFLRLLAKEEPT